MKKFNLATVIFVCSLAAIAWGTEDASNPILTWNTFMGSVGDEGATSVTLDPSGNIYIAGNSNDPWGTPVRAYTGNTDVFVAKLSPNGTLLWNTFLGASWTDGAGGIELDGAGNVYVSGESLASWGAPVRAFGGVSGTSDQFVAKLDAAGNLVWNSFIGGAGNEYITGLAVDGNGNSYPVGIGWSAWGSPLQPFAGKTDGTVAKVDSAGVLQWHTFLGGTQNDAARDAALDASGGLYLVGDSSATWGSPLQPFSGGTDLLVVKLNAGTGALVWHTFVGHAGVDAGRDIAWRVDGTVVAAGLSVASWGTPTVPFGGGDTDGLAVALQSDGVFLGHAFLGGPGGDSCEAVALNDDGSIYLGGYSTVGWGSPDRAYSGGDSDGFVARLSVSGGFQALTFMGGVSSDDVRAIALGRNREAYSVGFSDSTWGSPIAEFQGGTEAFAFKSTFLPEALTRHAIGDFDGDGVDEAAVDFGGLGVWQYDGGGWSQLDGGRVESLAALDIDGSGDDEILVDTIDGGLLLWDSGSVSTLSASDVEGLAVGDFDASGDEEVLADLGASGLWIYDLGHWTQFSGVNPDFMALAQLNGTGFQEIVADFGAVGLWIRQGTAWFQASGVNADFFACGDTDGNGTAEIVGDFGATGLWLFNGGAWTQLSGVNVNYLIMADTNGDNKADIIGDFGTVGLWLWSNGSWTMLSGMREDFMIAANVDGGAATEAFVDFGPVGLWAYAAGGWYQLSGVNADYLMSGDFDGDAQAELLVDFAALGLWVCDSGAWTQVSGVNPD